MDRRLSPLIIHRFQPECRLPGQDRQAQYFRYCMLAKPTCHRHRRRGYLFHRRRCHLGLSFSGRTSGFDPDNSGSNPLSHRVSYETTKLHLCESMPGDSSSPGNFQRIRGKEMQFTYNALKQYFMKFHLGEVTKIELACAIHMWQRGGCL